jgi:hypothetical protein
MELGSFLALGCSNVLHALCQRKSAEIGVLRPAGLGPAAIVAGRSLPVADI